MQLVYCNTDGAVDSDEMRIITTLRNCIICGSPEKLMLAARSSAGIERIDIYRDFNISAYKPGIASCTTIKQICLSMLPVIHES